MARRNFATQAYDSINLTPLIDTLFFLLIIFMLTAPLLEYSVDVSAPAMNADSLPQEADPKTKVVNLKRANTVNFEDSDMSQVLFLQRLVKMPSDAKIYLRADESLPYGDVIRFLASIRRSGFQNIFLITKEEGTE